MSELTLSASQVASYLGMSKKTIETYAIYSPELLPPFTKANGRLEFDIEDVIAFKRERDAILQYGFTAEEAAKYLGFPNASAFTAKFAETGWRPRRYKVGKKYYYFQQNLDLWAEKVGMYLGWRHPKKWNRRES